MNPCALPRPPAGCLPAFDCLSGLLAACSLTPRPVIRYQSAEPDDLWGNGLSLHRAAYGRLAFTSGFLELSRRTVGG
jgi:hypothetical protein